MQFNKSIVVSIDLFLCCVFWPAFGCLIWSPGNITVVYMCILIFGHKLQAVFLSRFAAATVGSVRQNSTSKTSNENGRKKGPTKPQCEIASRNASIQQLLGLHRSMCRFHRHSVSHLGESNSSLIRPFSFISHWLLFHSNIYTGTKEFYSTHTYQGWANPGNTLQPTCNYV